MKIFYSAILFCFILTFTSFAQDNTRLSKTWEVRKYDITATLPQTETDRDLGAKAVLSLKNVSSGTALTLTLRISPNAEVSAVKVNNSVTDFTKGEEKLGSGTLQKIGLRGLSVDTGGNLTVEVNYKLKVTDNSGLNTLSPGNSQFLPLSFWYPTPNSWFFARGADYAPFRVQVNAPNGQTITSSGTANGNVYESKLNGQPFFVTGDWELLYTAGVSVMMPTGADVKEHKRAAELAGLTSEVKGFMTNLLGGAPDAPLRIVPVRRGAGFADGGTILVDYSVFERQKTDSQTAMTIAEAIAKMWIGGAAQIRGDGEGAIREGLPQYLATQFLEQKYGVEIADIERLRQRAAYSAISKRDSPLNIVSPVDDFYFSEVSNKGAMIWRLLAKKVGQEEFFKTIRAGLQNGNLDLNTIRSAFPAQKDFLDYSFNQITDLNLLVGLPQVNGAETKIALRNTGSTEATVSVTAVTDAGEILTGQTTILAKSFGEINFKTARKIVRVEVDKEKFYPQTEYYDDIAPKSFDNSDSLLFIKQAFDKQNFAEAEKNARIVLQSMPEFDDAKVLFARALFAQGKTADAEKEFRAVLNGKLPTSRSLGWANEGLGEIALKKSQTAEAGQYFIDAVRADGEYGATLLARQGRNKTNAAQAADENIKQFFTKFDAAVISNRKADIDALVVTGEERKFVNGLSGQVETWQTKIIGVDKLDDNNYLVETNISTKLLSREPEGGTVVYRLSKINNVWKISGIEIFEVKQQV